MADDANNVSMNELNHDIECDRAFINGLISGWNLALLNDEKKQFILNSIIQNMLSNIRAAKKVLSND